MQALVLEEQINAIMRLVDHNIQGVWDSRRLRTTAVTGVNTVPISFSTLVSLKHFSGGGGVTT